MTRTGKTFALACVGLYLIAVVNDKEIGYHMCFAALSVLVAAFFLSRMALSGIHVSATKGRDRSFEGRSLVLTLKLENRGSLNKTNVVLELSLRNETQGTDHLGRWHLPALEAGEETEEMLPLSDLRRGVVLLRSLRLTAGDPLGMFVCNRRVALDRSLTVYPRRIALPPMPSALGGGEECSALAEAPTGRGEMEFHAVRPYVDGDDLRRVHWPTTARTGRLAVKEFEGISRRDALLLVDGSADGTAAAGDTFEARLRVAAALAEVLLAKGGGLAVQVTGRPPAQLPLERGDRQLVRALELLARVEAADGLSVEQALGRLLAALPQVGTVVVVSAHVPAGLARAAVVVRARHADLVVAHLASAATSEEARTREEATRRALPAAGVTVWPVAVETSEEHPETETPVRAAAPAWRLFRAPAGAPAPR